MREYTPRLKLITETDDELIDPFAQNWPILDTFAGNKVVADGVTPPNNELFDGCIVSEQTSGKVWIARLDPLTGTFTKHWAIYPWQIAISKQFFCVKEAGAFKPIPMDFLEGGQCINSSMADVVAGRVVTPIKGIYDVIGHGQWQYTPADFGARSMLISFNDDSDYTVSEECGEAMYNVKYNSSTMRTQPLDAGVTITLKVWNTGSESTVDSWLVVNLVTPL